MGLRLGVLRPGKHAPRPSLSALQKAAITAGVSYRGDLSGDTVLRVLTGDGPVPEPLRAHFRELLDDAPMSLLAEVAREIQDASAIPARTTWRRMRHVAKELRCKRRIWHEAARHEPAGSLEGTLSEGAAADQIGSRTGEPAARSRQARAAASATHAQNRALRACCFWIWPA